MKKLWCLLFFGCIHLLLFGQITMKLKPGPSVGKDAFIKNTPSTFNQSNRATLMANWGTSGSPYIGRSLFEFDLTQIPAGAQIDSIQLSLFGNPNTSLGEHTWSAGPNTSLLQRITSAWTETGVTWGTMPTTTTSNEVVLSASTSAKQDYLDIDVTDLVMDMINNPNSSYGFMFRLQTETGYRGMVFASSDCPDSLLWPELNIFMHCNVMIPLSFVEYCPGQGVTFKGVYYDSPTFIEDTVQHPGTCDSVYQYLIREKVLATGTIKSVSNSLYYSGTATSLQWIDCDTDTPVPNATAAIYKPSGEGRYSVAVEIDGCLDTTACFQFTPTGIDASDEKYSPVIFPNPFKNKIYVQNISRNEVYQYELYNVHGKLLSRGVLTDNIETNLLRTGTYFLLLQSPDSKFAFKLVKN